MILLIDNYDSFTYNLYQLIGKFRKDIVVRRNDTSLVDYISSNDIDRIIISPGPKRPEEAGECIEVIRRFYKELPILGICLGHQCIGYAFGAKIELADELFHGKKSLIRHEGDRIFEGLGRSFEVARYHSLVVNPTKESNEKLRVIAKTEDDVVMGIRHKEYPVIGLQFHPESVYTPEGKKIIENFLLENRRGEYVG